MSGITSNVTIVSLVRLDPSLAVFCRYVQTPDIHCVTEGHLIMRLGVLTFRPP